MQDSLYMALIERLPRKQFGRSVRQVVGWTGGGPIPRLAVKWFAGHYGVNLDEAELPLGEYPNLHSFFTRKLKVGARPVDMGSDVVVSPVDGVISEHGEIRDGQLTQVKGKTYPLVGLMGGEAEAAPFQGGTWLTIYLSPRHYHRIHSPVDGDIVRYDHIPGELWPVNEPSVRSVPELFCVNERLTTFVKLRGGGEVAVIKVGAVGVGHISLSYADCRTNLPGQSRQIHVFDPPIPVVRGGELGSFELGSTVVLVFPPGKVGLEVPPVGTEITMGRRIGLLMGES